MKRMTRIQFVLATMLVAALAAVAFQPQLTAHAMLQSAPGDNTPEYITYLEGARLPLAAESAGVVAEVPGYVAYLEGARLPLAPESVGVTASVPGYIVYLEDARQPLVTDTYDVVAGAPDYIQYLEGARLPVDIADGAYVRSATD
jgi:hypothetical protein